MHLPLALFVLAAADPSGSDAPPLSTLLPPAVGQEEQEPPRSPRTQRPSPAWPIPDHWLEVAVGHESSVSLGYRAALHIGGGYGGAGLLLTDDEGWALNGKLMRFGRPDSDLPLTLGVGLGLYGVFADDPNEDGYSITFIGHAEYLFETAFPTNVSLEVAYGPDATTFEAGNSLVDVTSRIGIELGAYARAFAGYRFLELGLDGRDAELENAFQVGIGLAW